MDEPGRARDANIEINVPSDLEVGVYANFLNVWHTQHEFTLDFGCFQPPEVPEDEDEPVMIPARVVARVRIAPTLVFAVLQALNINMTRYEQSHGEIRRPDQPGEPAA